MKNYQIRVDCNVKLIETIVRLPIFRNFKRSFGSYSFPHIKYLLVFADENRLGWLDYNKNDNSPFINNLITLDQFFDIWNYKRIYCPNKIVFDMVYKYLYTKYPESFCILANYGDSLTSSSREKKSNLDFEALIVNILCFIPINILTLQVIV